MSSTGELRTIDEKGNIITAKIDEAIKCLPQTVAYYNNLAEEVKRIEMEVGKGIRSIDEGDDADAKKAKDVLIAIRKRDDERLTKLEIMSDLREMIHETNRAKAALEKEEKRKRDQVESEKRKKEAEDARKRNEEANKSKEATEWRWREYELRLKKLEQAMRDHGLTDSESGSEGCRNKRSNGRERSAGSEVSSHDSNDTDGDGSGSSHRRKTSSKHHDSRKHPTKNKKSSRKSTSSDREDYTKVPELLPEFTSEENDPEQFVSEFNDVLECIGEESNPKNTFWFKRKVKIVGSRWDAGLSPKRHSLSVYQKEFLAYFWSATMQRIAMEDFERASLNMNSDVAISRQILNWYARVKKIRIDPVSDSKFIREIIKKLPREARGLFICDRDRSVAEFAAKVAEVVTEGGYARRGQDHRTQFRQNHARNTNYPGGSPPRRPDNRFNYNDRFCQDTRNQNSRPTYDTRSWWRSRNNSSPQRRSPYRSYRNNGYRSEYTPRSRTSGYVSDGHKSGYPRKYHTGYHDRQPNHRRSPRRSSPPRGTREYGLNPPSKARESRYVDKKDTYAHVASKPKKEEKSSKVTVKNPSSDSGSEN